MQSFQRYAVTGGLTALVLCTLGCTGMDMRVATATSASMLDPLDPPSPVSRALAHAPAAGSSALGDDAIQPVSAALAESAGLHEPFPDCSPTAAPMDCGFCWHSDFECLGSDLWNDAHSVCRCDNALILLAAGGASLAVRARLDDTVSDDTARHPHRWGDTQDFFGAIGNPGHHFAAVAGLYAYSLWACDVESHELSKTLFNALALTGLSTMALKAITDTEAPNRQPDEFGGSWPSGHTSSSVAVAAVLDEYYGHWVGLPAYVLAGLVGWERIDDREHDLSDVIFGAALGYVIGRTVAAEHHARFCGMELQPYIDPYTGATGLGVERRY